MRARTFLIVALLLGIGLSLWTVPVAGAAQDPSAAAPQHAQAVSGVAEVGAGEHAGGHHAGGHGDPFEAILLEFALLIVVAVAGRALASKLGQPSVLGELLAGVAVGNIGYLLGLKAARVVMHLSDAQAIFTRVFAEGESVREAVVHLASSGAVKEELVGLVTGPGGDIVVLITITLWLFSNLGVILLLFLVGLESSVQEMRSVGVKSTRVAVTGVVLPLALGAGAARLLLPDLPSVAHLFVGATLCATSVGITAAVLKDMGRLQTPEAKIILGAAVLDDVLGLIVLAVVVGIVATGEVDPLAILKTTGLAFGFLGAVLLLGDRLVQATAGLFRAFDRANLKLLPPLVIAFVLSGAAARAGLAPIVGAFAAGLIVSEKHLQLGEPGEPKASEVLAPLERVFAPVFFVLMGMQVDLRTFGDATTLGLGLALVTVGVLGKLLAGWAVGRGHDALTIGIGMVPRGEVGLIFAGIGRALGVITDALFAAIVLMVIVTTVVAPLGLRWSTARSARRAV